MGFIQNLFSPTKTEQQKTASSQQGTSSTQNNLWSQASPFAQQYLQQYSPGNIASVQSPINAWQTGALSNQSSLFSPVAGIANQGISAADISKYMSPYLSSVIEPTKALQAQQNEQALSSLRGNMAAKGALGNNVGTEAAYLSGVVPGQQAVLGNLLNQGYGQAGQLAAQSANTQLQGAQTGSGLAQGQFNMGETARLAELQNMLTPFSLFSQGIQGLTGLGGLAGSTVNTSGTSTGTGTGTTTATPSLGGILSGLAGLGLGFFADGGRVKGMPSFHDEPFEQKVVKAFNVIQDLKHKARGGMVGRAEGGDVGLGSWTPVVTPEPQGPSAYQKFGEGLKGFSQATQDAENKSMQGSGLNLGAEQQALGQFLSGMANSNRPMYPYGGAVPDYAGIPGLPGSPSGVTDDERPVADPHTLWRRWRAALNSGEMNPAMDRTPNPGYETATVSPNDAMTPIFAVGPDAGIGSIDSAPISDLPRARMEPTSAMMPPLPERKPFQAPRGLGASDVPPPARAPAPKSHWYDGISKPFSTGVWAGQEATPLQRIGAALTQVGDSPFKGYGEAIMGWDQQRLKQLEADREAAKIPAQIKALEAQAALARASSDKEWLLEIEKKKMEYAKQLALAQQRAQYDLVNQILNNPGAALQPGRYQWVPQAPMTAPGDTEAPETEDEEP